jgi:hypothetical protein
MNPILHQTIKRHSSCLEVPRSPSMLRAAQHLCSQIVGCVLPSSPRGRARSLTRPPARPTMLRPTLHPNAPPVSAPIFSTISQYRNFSPLFKQDEAAAAPSPHEEVVPLPRRGVCPASARPSVLGPALHLTAPTLSAPISTFIRCIETFPPCTKSRPAIKYDHYIRHTRPIWGQR